MARKDFYHDHVRKCLESDGWKITHDPYKIKVGGIYQEIDLGAEKLLAAEKNNEKIVVEIKSFIHKSPLTSFHEALGKFRNYRRALRMEGDDRILFLAVPEPVFNKFFSKPFIQAAVLEEELLLLVYSITSTIIVSWKK